MNRKTIVIGMAFLAVVLGVIVYSSMNLSGYRVEVCVDYKGMTSCKTASGSEESFALRTAIGNACAVIISGVTDTIACQGTPPKSVKWLKRGD